MAQNQINRPNTDIRYVHYKEIDPSDIYEDTPTIVKGVFSNGSGTLAGTSMFTSSISASNKVFYYTMKDAAGAEGVDYFDIAFGHYAGTGSDLALGDSAIRESETVYWQHANIVDDDPRDKITFADISGSDMGAGEDYIWAINFKSAKVTGKLSNKFTLSLSGSTRGPVTLGQIATGSTLVLTTWTGSVYSSQLGEMYKITSGSAGVAAVDPSNDNGYTTYGNFYPEAGLIILAGSKLSASLPGLNSTSGTLDQSKPGMGFTPDTSNVAGGADIGAGNKNAWKMVMALRSGSMIMRTEQELNQQTIYCRLNHNEYNGTSNQTMIVSGSQFYDLQDWAIGNPTVYVTGIGLYDVNFNLLAVAKLNTAQQKHSNKELHILTRMETAS
tara:strand:+ start:13691 stop:14845 length:1155 start_codon:yes stop_codon:yes gene_type:complete